MGVSSAAGKSVTPDTVLQLATAWSCIRLLSETIGTLPLLTYRRNGEAKSVAPDLPLYGLLHDSPNADQTAAEFLEAIVACLCLWGNFYGEKQFFGSRLVAVDQLKPDLMRVRRNKQGRRVYCYSGPDGYREMDEERVFHVRGFGVGGIVGLSPISYARQTMGTALAADETAAETFRNGLQISGFIKEAAGTKSTSAQRKELLELFNGFMGSLNAGKVMPLPHGFDFAGISMNPEDAQLLQTRRFHVEEICRWFRVPPFMIGHTEKSTSWGTGLEQQMIGFLTFSLRPYLTRIEQAIKKQLIGPSERSTIFAEFNLEGLLRADSQGRAALLSALGQNGFLTRNEGRALDNRAPMPGGDMLTVQSNLLPLDQLGRQDPASNQVRSAMLSLLFGGSLEEVIDQRLKSMMGHNGGPALDEE
ncbi:phage portal protein [Ensifer sp. ENS08]|uniref:phage portal protein n=1 Tax=Ensifer sp. ENS08 TaxID=2769273 RepID=UPI00178507D7|nr:phage portal protein [Ensifer sp. ENS08]MBD9571745.1 phage portal protein [Ensifer sp. ENS08]